MKIIEKKLLFKVKNKKDQDAFGELYDLYVEKIYRFVYFKISNKEEAEDITSTVFLKTWQYLIADSKKEVRSFSGLVYQIARNSIIDFYRWKSTKQECSIEHIKEISVEDDTYTSIEMDQDVESLMKTLRKLKQEYQEVVMLKHVEELSTAEVAEILGKSKTNVRVTLHRATKKLKDLIDQ